MKRVWVHAARSFRDAEHSKVKARYGRTSIYVLGRLELIQTKRIANRSQDQLDLKRLSTARRTGYR
jgi:hypothetical protein